MFRDEFHSVTPRMEYYQRSAHQMRIMLSLAKSDERKQYWSNELAQVQAKIAREAWRFAEEVTEERRAA